MKKALPLLLLGLLCQPPAPALAEVDWQASPALKTATPPLDVAISADGERTFVLAEGGKVLIYDPAGKLTDSLDVDPAMDRIAADGNGGRLLLSSHRNGAAYQLDLSYRYTLDYSDSPFMGKAEAPVVLAFFSDFQ